MLRQLHHIQICPTDPTADRPLDRAPIMSNDSLTDLCWLQDATDDAEKQPEPTLTEQQKLLFVQPPRSRGNQEGRPQLSFAALIALAIGSTRNTGLTLSGIYQWIEQAFPFFRSAEAKAWRNSVRHNLSVRRLMFEKSLTDNRVVRSRTALWLLKDPDGLREYEKAVAILPSLAEKTVNREFVDVTMRTGQFQLAPAQKDSGGVLNCSAEERRLSITQQARTFLMRHSRDRAWEHPQVEGSNDSANSSTLSATEPDCAIKTQFDTDASSSDTSLHNIIRKRKPPASSIIKRKRSFNAASLPPRPCVEFDARSTAYSCKYMAAAANKENHFTPPHPPKSHAYQTSPTLLQLFTNEEGESPSLGFLSSPVTPLKGYLSEMDSGIITPVRQEILSALPVVSLSPGLIPPLSNSTPHTAGHWRGGDSGLSSSCEGSYLRPCHRSPGGREPTSVLFA